MKLFKRACAQNFQEKPAKRHAGRPNASHSNAHTRSEILPQVRRLRTGIGSGPEVATPGASTVKQTMSKRLPPPRCQKITKLSRKCLLAPSLSHHHLHELFVVDLAVTVHVGLSNHLVNLLVRELLPEVGHHVAQLGGADEAVAVAVEDLERLDQLLLRAH